MDLQNKVALITGGKRIGLVVAEELARRGADVALVVRALAPGSRGSRGARARGRATRGRPPGRSDHRRRPAGRRVDGAASALGRLDILINMASVYARTAVRRADASPTGTARSTSICARPSCARRRPCRTCARRAAAASSTSATGLLDERPPALRGLPAVLRRQGRRHGAHRGAGARAGRRQHPRERHRTGPDPRAARQRPTRKCEAVEDATPLGRWGGEAEIAKAVLALLDSDFITGETIRVDGGRHFTSELTRTQDAQELDGTQFDSVPQCPAVRSSPEFGDDSGFVEDCRQDSRRAADRQVADVEVARAGVERACGCVRAQTSSARGAAARTRASAPRRAPAGSPSARPAFADWRCGRRTRRTRPAGPAPRRPAASMNRSTRAASWWLTICVRKNSA